MDRTDVKFPPAELPRRSLEVLLENQAPSGAFVASPNFPTYRFCWFRDSAYVAYALDLVGEHAAAARFHGWAAKAINQRAEVVQRALQWTPSGPPLSEAEILHTRYTLEGQDSLREEWPNFQLDGFGTWLWALQQHQRLSGAVLPVEWIQAASLTASYLAALWRQPCFDCWEEFSDKIHLHTLAAIYGGLAACQEVDGLDRSGSLAAIKEFVFANGIVDGHFSKFVGSDTVDASLIGLCLPYHLVPPLHPVMQATVDKIEALLVRGGGVHRYATDTYYGGGEWVLLAGWLGWYYAETGQPEKARRMLQWMETTATPSGDLPEQIPATLNDGDYYTPWLERWGPIASPLLWSHAKYLILRKAL